MVYDEHYQSGPPGPVASQEWFEKQLDRLLTQAPASKVVIGVGNYGYDWVIGGRGAAEVAFNDVMAASVSNKTSVEWDDDTDNPVLRYTLAGAQHEVWFLDAITALNHAVEVADRGFRGVGIWRLGGEDPGMWHVLSHANWPAHTFDTSILDTLGVQQASTSMARRDHSHRRDAARRQAAHLERPGWLICRAVSLRAHLLRHGELRQGEGQAAVHHL